MLGVTACIVLFIGTARFDEPSSIRDPEADSKLAYADQARTLVRVALLLGVFALVALFYPTIYKAIEIYIYAEL